MRSFNENEVFLRNSSSQDNQFSQVIYNNRDREKKFSNEQLSSSRRNINYSTELFPSMLRQFNDNNQFKVSNNSSFKFFSDQKDKREKLEEEVERQRRFCYSEQLRNSTNISNDENNRISLSQLKHQEKVKKQLDSSIKSILGVKQNMNNQSLCSNSKLSNGDYHQDGERENQIQENPNLSRRQSQCMQEQLFNNFQDSIKHTSIHEQLNSNEGYEVEKQASSQVQEVKNNETLYSILKRNKGTIKDILFIASVFLSLYYFFSTYLLASEFFKNHSQSEGINQIEFENLRKIEFSKQISDSERKKDSINFSSDFVRSKNNDSSHSYPQNNQFDFDTFNDEPYELLKKDVEHSHSQQIIVKADKYYNQFLNHIKKEGSTYRNEFEAILIKEEFEDHKEIFELVKAARQKAGQILETKLDNGFIIWIKK